MTALEKNRDTIIAAVDSGVELSHPWLRGCRFAPGVCLREGEGGAVERSADFAADPIGHGTSVASLIHAFCPEAAICPVRLANMEFAIRDDSSPPACEALVAEGIRWCVKQAIPIINVSVSIEEVDKDGPLERACREANRAGCIVVASYRTAKPPIATYPAGFPTVVGVRWEPDCAPGEVRPLSRENFDLATWGGPMITAYRCAKTACLKGASYSSAAISAMIGRMFLVQGPMSASEIYSCFEKLAGLSGAVAEADASFRAH